MTSMAEPESCTFTQDEWDEVEIMHRGQFLRDRGVPISDNGEPFAGFVIHKVELNDKNEPGQVSWKYTWGSPQAVIAYAKN